MNGSDNPDEVQQTLVSPYLTPRIYTYSTPSPADRISLLQCQRYPCLQGLVKYLYAALSSCCRLAARLLRGFFQRSRRPRRCAAEPASRVTLSSHIYKRTLAALSQRTHYSVPGCRGSYVSNCPIPRTGPNSSLRPGSLWTRRPLLSPTQTGPPLPGSIALQTSAAPPGPGTPRIDRQCCKQLKSILIPYSFSLPLALYLNASVETGVRQFCGARYLKNESMVERNVGLIRELVTDFF